MIKQSIAKVVEKEDLTESEMEQTMEEIMTGKTTPAQIAAYRDPLGTVTPRIKVQVAI